MSVKVPVHTTGDPVGVKLQGGHYELVNREVEIEVLPDDIPEHFTVDVSQLKLNDSVRGKDIPLSGSMRLISDPELVLSHVVSLRAEAEATAEGGAAEPEVAKKGKKVEAAPAAKAAKGAAPAAKAPAAKAPAAKKK